MLSVDTLRAWGANVDEGLGRCLRNEAFYLKLVDKALQDPAFDRLKDAEIRIEIKKNFQNRSLDANAYCWVIIDKISEVTGIPKSQVSLM